MSARAASTARLGRALVASAIVSACGGAPEPPPRVAHEDATSHLLRIGTAWSVAGEERGVLEHDPYGVVSFRVREETTYAIGPGRDAKRTIVRDEVFGMASGAELHCSARGTTPVVVRTWWSEREVRVELAAAGGCLARTCTGGELPVKTKDVSPSTAVFALREDRLVPIEPATLHDVLLPQ